MFARCPCREYAGTLRNVDFSEIAEYCGSLLKAQQHVSFSANRKPGKSCCIYTAADCVIGTVCHDKDPLWCDQSTTTDVKCECLWETFHGSNPRLLDCHSAKNASHGVAPTKPQNMLVRCAFFCLQHRTIVRMCSFTYTIQWGCCVPKSII